MAFALEEVREERDYDEIVPVLYAAFGHPYNSLRKWFIPVHTTTEAALEDFKGRLLKSWKQKPDLYWIKVTDTETGRIVGAAEWEVRKTIEEPRSEPEPLNAYWHTEGSEEKQFAEKMLT
ncbi:hypothetical protein BDV96DRAFT_653881 [Lophiotrema nucula]|uniref:N-acetyltransferase domain-containing protein n=1 Tax=Lophiotrema nucula TaxID=690887 RepID=A0A6A5YJ60_9PLEO|nr:hypothetical protein BDV96DRAFT_653881 [Lophiotrema nucula]